MKEEFGIQQAWSNIGDTRVSRSWEGRAQWKYRKAIYSYDIFLLVQAEYAVRREADDFHLLLSYHFSPVFRKWKVIAFRSMFWTGQTCM